MIERNKIYNCDCLELLKELPDKSVDVTFTSPPYNSKRFKKYDQFNDNFTDYFSFVRKVIEECLRVSKRYVIFNIQANCYNKSDVFKIIGAFSEKIQRIVIWVKQNPAPSSLRNRLTNAHEYFLILSTGETVMCNSVFLRDVIEFPVNSSRNSGHKAAMNKDVCAFFIKEFTRPGDLVFDPFMGTGTTAVVCAENERDYLGTEIVKEYCDGAIERVRNESNLQTSMDGLLKTC